MGKPDVFIYELGLQLPRTEDQASLIRIQQGLSTTALGTFGADTFFEKGVSWAL